MPAVAHGWYRLLCFNLVEYRPQQTKELRMLRNDINRGISESYRIPFWGYRRLSFDKIKKRCHGNWYYGRTQPRKPQPNVWRTNHINDAQIVPQISISTVQLISRPCARAVSKNPCQSVSIFKFTLLDSQAALTRTRRSVCTPASPAPGCPTLPVPGVGLRHQRPARPEVTAGEVGYERVLRFWLDIHKIWT